MFLACHFPGTQHGSVRQEETPSHVTLWGSQPVASSPCPVILCLLHIQFPGCPVGPSGKEKEKHIYSKQVEVTGMRVSLDTALSSYWLGLLIFLYFIKNFFHFHWKIFLHLESY